MIETALIPVAGLGTRLRPVTAVVPKALFPLVDTRGRVRAVLHLILSEAAAAGARRVGVVVSPAQREMIEGYLAAAREAEGDDAGLPESIELLDQPRPEGFGASVLRGRELVARDERFLLLLGDHVHLAEPGAPPCARQVAEALEAHGGAAMIGMQTVEADQLALVGVAAGEPAAERVYRCRDFVEKPDAATARRRLATRGLGPGEFLAHCGIYAFTTEIFECLSRVAADVRTPGGEVELADAQSMLLDRHAEDYFLYRIAGRSLDTGTPACYAAAQAALTEERRRPANGAER